MAQQEPLIRVTGALDEIGCAYMLTGSFASSLHGEPRLSHDIDLVVDITLPAIPALVRRFPAPDFFLDEASARAAVSGRDMFNLLSVPDGDNVDFWILTDDPFDVARFERRRRESVLGTTIVVASPEGTILAKLRWARLSGGSEKHFRDAVGVYQVQSPRIDGPYLERWIGILQLQGEWSRLLKEAES